MSEKKKVIIGKLQKISIDIANLKLLLKTKEANITEIGDRMLALSNSKTGLESTIQKLNTELSKLKSTSTEGNEAAKSEIISLNQRIKELGQIIGISELQIQNLNKQIEELNKDTDSILVEVDAIEEQFKSVAVKGKGESDGGRKKSRSRRKRKSMKHSKKKSKKKSMKQNKKSMKQIKKSMKQIKKKSRKKSRKYRRRF